MLSETSKFYLLRKILKIKIYFYNIFKRFVISGSGSKDGSIAVWRSSREFRKSILTTMKKMVHFDETTLT